jgi:hypothetical protein
VIEVSFGTFALVMLVVWLIVSKISEQDRRIRELEDERDDEDDPPPPRDYE